MKLFLIGMTPVAVALNCIFCSVIQSFNFRVHKFCNFFFV